MCMHNGGYMCLHIKIRLSSIIGNEDIKSIILLIIDSISATGKRLLATSSDRMEILSFKICI